MFKIAEYWIQPAPASRDSRSLYFGKATSESVELLDCIDALHNHLRSDALLSDKDLTRGAACTLGRGPSGIITGQFRGHMNPTATRSLSLDISYLDELPSRLVAEYTIRYVSWGSVLISETHQVASH